MSGESTNLGKLLIATGNPGKYKQVLTMLDGLEGFELVFLGDLQKELGVDFGEPVEDGETFAENAYKKARYYFEKTGFLTLAEDSGLLVDALPGELGVKTRRWGAGAKASDQEWIDYFLERMKGVPASERGARFVSCVCLVGWSGFGETVGGRDEELVEKYFQGECKGLVTMELEAEVEEGIPLSACFKPEGKDRVYSALTDEERFELSHRGLAMGQAREWLENL